MIAKTTEWNKKIGKEKEFRETQMTEFRNNFQKEKKKKKFRVLQLKLLSIIHTQKIRIVSKFHQTF